MSSNRPPSSHDSSGPEVPEISDVDQPTLPPQQFPAEPFSTGSSHPGPANLHPRFASVPESSNSGSFVGATFGDYEILEEIARGGMGIVYRARQKSLDRIVALKMILGGQFASEDEIRRFNAESTAAAKLDHPNIVPIYDSGVHGDHHYFSMKLIEGKDLGRDVKRLRTDLKAGVAVLEKICRAIHHAHQRGILHRDLKPGNILIDSDGEPYLTDLGLARQVGSDSHLTRTGAVVGTPSYMPPEQAAGSGDITTAVDVYSLGAILYELLTGRPPFRGDNVMVTLMQVIHDAPERPSLSISTDRNLEMVAMKCLSKSPADRYVTAEAMADDLQRWLNGEPVSVRAPSFSVVARNWLRQNFGHAIWILIVGLLAGSLAGLGLWFATIQHDMDQIRSIYADMPSVEAPLTLAAWKTPDWAVIPFMVLFTSAIMFIGYFTAALARTKNRSADLAAGITVGIISAAAAFFVCFGTLCVIAMNFGNQDIQLVSKASAVPDGEMTEDVQNLLDEYPELASKSRGEQTQMMLRKIKADHLYQARNGILMGTLSCLILFLTAGVVETVMAGPIIRSSPNLGHAMGRYVFSTYPFVVTTVIVGVHLTGVVVLGHHGIIWNWIRVLTFIVLGLGMWAEIRRWHWGLRLPLVMTIGVLFGIFFAYSFSMMPVVASSHVDVNKRLRLARRNPDNMHLADRAIHSILRAGVRLYEHGYYRQADKRFVQSLEYIGSIPADSWSDDIRRQWQISVMNRANALRKQKRITAASEFVLAKVSEYPCDLEFLERVVDFFVVIGDYETAQFVIADGVARSSEEWNALRELVCLAYPGATLDQLQAAWQSIMERSSLDPSIQSQLKAGALRPQVWRLLGPFQGEEDRLPMESRLVSLRTVQEVAELQPSGSWKKKSTLDALGIDLLKVFGAVEDVSCFALGVVVVEGDVAKTVEILVGSDDFSSVWLNGNCLQQASEDGRAYRAREDRLVAKLQPGPNVVLLRIDQRAGQWKFGLQLDAENGWALPVQWLDD